MTYFAEIKNNKVVRVIVSSKENIEKNYTGEWIETERDSVKENKFAGIGDDFDRLKFVFIPKRPNNNYIMNNFNKWELI
jgi:hypothetical protein